MSDHVPLDLIGVRIELPTNTPILLLRERGGNRYLPIWIGTPEATAIALATEHVTTDRPLTHDLAASLIEELGGRVTEVVVTELRGGTYFADLRIEAGEDTHTVSSRPSDAVAIAVRVDAPLFAERELLDQAGIEIRDESDEEQIEKFREFLDEIDPEDFDPSSTS
ncbi:MAG: bifunctional nuclease family protein [Acidimicrobiia bacterium]|nr:bifunctional nuclease family protein [Acidimicrobiia bacterium]